MFKKQYDNCFPVMIRADQFQIKYANKRNVQFLAMTGGHEATDTLSRVNNGIEIWMRKLNSIAIAPDGTTATIGGGVLSKEITDALWTAGKQTGQVYDFQFEQFC